MKKFLTLFLTLVLCLTSFTFFGCKQPEKDKVNIMYYSDASKIVPLIMAGEETVGLIPEPAATALTKNAQKKGKTIYRLDLQELYDDVEKAYPQAVLMVKKSVINAHPNLVENLQNKITESVAWAKENVSDVVSTIGNKIATTLDANTLSADVIDACKIYWQSAEQSKNSVKKYIDNIIEIDSEKATAVSDDFFYTPSSGSNNKTSYKFVMPDGAPAIAMSKLMKDGDNLSTDKIIEYEVITAKLIQTYLSSGTADFVLAPVNLASKLYKAHDKDDHYVMVAVITHGNFYIMSTEQITINDLAGRQIAVPMKGAVPDWTFKMVLKKHKLSYSTVE